MKKILFVERIEMELFLKKRIEKNIRNSNVCKSTRTTEQNCALLSRFVKKNLNLKEITCKRQKKVKFFKKFHFCIMLQLLCSSALHCIIRRYVKTDLCSLFKRLNKYFSFNRSIKQ